MLGWFWRFAFWRGVLCICLCITGGGLRTLVGLAWGCGIALAWVGLAFWCSVCLLRFFAFVSGWFAYLLMRWFEVVVDLGFDFWVWWWSVVLVYCVLDLVVIACVSGLGCLLMTGLL